MNNGVNWPIIELEDKNIICVFYDIFILVFKQVKIC